MKFTWKGNWRSGEIVIEAETLEELNKAVDMLLSLNKGQTTAQVGVEEIPKLSSGLGCSDAIRTLLQSEWGKKPRYMAEIRNALETNALYFSKGTLSGTLNLLTKGGQLRRVKKAGKWRYTAE